MKDKKLLIIEDDISIHSLYKMVFEGAGFHTEISMDGDNTITVVEQFTPDMMLLDIILPKRDGIAIIHEMKQHPEWKDLPIVVLSNYDKEDKIQMARSLGVADYLIKTNYSLAEVVTRVQQVLKANDQS